MEGEHIRMNLKKLIRSAKAYEINEFKVNNEEKIVYSLLDNNTKFNDCHIVAIFRVSKCKIFCSEDKSSDKYITDNRLYHKGQRHPSIYRSRNHKNLLCDSNIVDIRRVIQN
jgi:hypothetical protein